MRKIVLTGKAPMLNVSYKPQKISPKSQGTVRQLLHEKIRDAYIHPQFITDVIKPLQIEQLYDQEVRCLLFVRINPFPAAIRYLYTYSYAINRLICSFHFCYNTPIADISDKSAVNCSRSMKSTCMRSGSDAYFCRHIKMTIRKFCSSFFS